jgi:hypothetical protein
MAKPITGRHAVSWSTGYDELLSQGEYVINVFASLHSKT